MQAYLLGVDGLNRFFLAFMAVAPSFFGLNGMARTRNLREACLLWRNCLLYISIVPSSDRVMEEFIMILRNIFWEIVRLQTTKRIRFFSLE